MNRITIGQLCQRFSLSRSTLLYYDKLGLCKPSVRGDNRYRYYSGEDVARLERVLQLESTGLTLVDIKRILDDGSKEMSLLLESRLKQLHREILDLKKQQWVIAQLLRTNVTSLEQGFPNKEQWGEMFRSIGLNEQQMWQWHREFETNQPSAHESFLRLLGMDVDEIHQVRLKSKNI